MTNGSSDRLNLIQALVESNARAIAQTQQQIDSNARVIAANSDRIAEVDRTLSEAVGRTLRGIDELREIVEEDRVNFYERMEQTDTIIAGINATLAVLQQLMRDRHEGNQPPA